MQALVLNTLGERRVEVAQPNRFHPLNQKDKTNKQDVNNVKVQNHHQVRRYPAEASFRP